MKSRALEAVLVLGIGAALDEDLAADRLRRLDAFAKVGRIDRRVAPAEKNLALLGDNFSTIASTILRGLRGRAAGTTAPMAYSPGAGKSKPSSRAFAAKKRCGICTSMPQPSPALGSAPTAPR